MADEKNLTTQSGSISVPYLNAYGVITKALDRIKDASTPDRFTQDFLAAKLGLKGGSARPIIPYLKRIGFLNSDGTPSELYKKFRNESFRPQAAAVALKKGYSGLYEIHEYVHDLSEKELKGIIVQATGLDANSSTTRAIMGSYGALKAFANFDEAEKNSNVDEVAEKQEQLTSAPDHVVPSPRGIDLKLGYTINLNLPATSDVAVFNAIFKSLREHLLDK